MPKVKRENHMKDAKDPGRKPEETISMVREWETIFAVSPGKQPTPKCNHVARDTGTHSPEH
jgi:hypothetical protein